MKPWEALAVDAVNVPVVRINPVIHLSEPLVGSPLVNDFLLELFHERQEAMAQLRFNVGDVGVENGELVPRLPRPPGWGPEVECHCGYASSEYRT